VNPAIIGGGLAIVGGLAGSTLTSLGQRKRSREDKRFQFDQRLRGDRLSAFSSLAGAAMELRRAELNRWHQHHFGPNSDAFEAAKAECYRCRADARKAFFQTQLVSDNQDLNMFAKAALDGVLSLHEASTKEELDKQSEVGQDGIGKFVDAATRYLAVTSKPT
jgi:type II secretory pathway pseudopilin PulG